MRTITYEDWSKMKGRESEWGIKAIVTDKLLRDNTERVAIVGKQMGNAVASALQRNGLRAQGKPAIELERDALLRGTEVILVTNTLNGESPEEYVGMAFQAWQEEQTHRMNWENKSLWGYIKYWVRRSYAKLS